MNKKFNVCVVGATGAVGETILSILDERDFPINNLYPLAIILRCVYSAIACGLTSGTTKGMSLSRRKCAVLSITIQPACAAIGATGAVGETILSILDERDFPINNLYPLASANSAGKRVFCQGKSWTVQQHKH
jgi:aspartate-semialdehyde dehydrogenase